MEHRPTADQSVLSILIVHQKLHVSTENVKTPVLDCVEEMLTAELETMYQYVSAIRDSLEIHSLAATDLQQPHQDQKSLTPADQVHVESMQSAERGMEQLHVLVFQDYLEIPMLSANQSVPSMQNAPPTKLVSTKSVLIPVLEFVEPMLHVQSKITIHPAHVTQVILEIHSDTAQELQHYQFLQKSSTHASHLHVDQMLSVMKDKELPPVNVFQTTLEILMWHVDQSVWSTQIVHQAKHVNNFTALTHVQEHVE